MHSPNPHSNFSPPRLHCLGPGVQQKTPTITACKLRLERQHAKKPPKILSGQSPVSSFLRAQIKPQLSDLAPLGEKVQPPPLPEGCAHLQQWDQVVLVSKGRESCPGVGTECNEAGTSPLDLVEGGDDLHFSTAHDSAKMALKEEICFFVFFITCLKKDLQGDGGSQVSAVEHCRWEGWRVGAVGAPETAEPHLGSCRWRELSVTRGSIREIGIVPPNRGRDRHRELGAVLSFLPAADNCSAGWLCVTRQR